MKYLMLVISDANLPETPETPSLDSWLEECDRRKARLMGDQLAPASDGETVRVRSGELVVTDGPFTETNELIAGFDVLECASLDEAVELASRHPMAHQGTIEVRAFWQG